MINPLITGGRDVVGIPGLYQPFWRETVPSLTANLHLALNPRGRHQNPTRWFWDLINQPFWRELGMNNWICSWDWTNQDWELTIYQNISKLGIFQQWQVESETVDLNFISAHESTYSGIARQDDVGVSENGYSNVFRQLWQVEWGNHDQPLKLLASNFQSNPSIDGYEDLAKHG